MLLQSSAAPSPALKPLFHTLAQKSPLQVPIQQDDGEPFSPEIFREHAFRFFLQWRFPRAALEWWGDHPDRLQPAFLEPLSQTLLTFFDQSQLSPRAWLVLIHGSSLLWEQFWQAYRDWRAWKCPAPQRYRLQIEKTCTSYQKRLIIWPEERQSPVSHALHFPLA